MRERRSARLALAVVAMLPQLDRRANAARPDGTQAVPALVVRLPVRNLQMLAADQDLESSRRWLVWDHGFGVGQSVDIALCRTDGACLWKASWPDAYLPVIANVAGWSTELRSILLVTFHFGADAQEGDIFELEPNKLPRLLDHRLAASLSLTPDGTHLELYHSLGSSPGKECLGWNGRVLKLVSVRCRG